MPFLLPKRVLRKRRLLLASAGALFMIGIGVVVALQFGRVGSQAAAIEPDADSVVDLGVTYVRITPAVSTLYGLAVTSGALVTEVIPGGLAQRAGVQAGDVILTFNGAAVEQGMPLLALIRSCPAGSSIELEVCRQDSRQVVEVVQGDK